MNHEILGEGTYGCVIKPYLKCKSNKKLDYIGRVSKIMREKDAKEELAEMDKIKNIDNIEKYTIRTPIKCKPKIDDKFDKIVSNCTTNNVASTYNLKKNKLSQLLVDDGGLDLHKFSNKIYENLSLHDQKIFMTSLLHLFKGLKFFSENDIIHQDIKSLNIVYNVANGKIRYIDFGLAISKKEFIKSSRMNSNRMAQSWSYYPPEFSCANYSSFVNSSRGKCKELYADYGNSINQYTSFINDLANSFDSYCLTLAIKKLLSTIYYFKGNKINKHFLKSLNSLMNEYSESDLTLRNKNLDDLISRYKGLLNKYEIYTKAKPTPSPQIIEVAETLSLELSEKTKLVRCPPTMPEFNPFTRKCVKKCKDGKVRNDKFRCVQNKTKKKKSSTKDSDEILNSVNKKMKECKEKDKDYNPLTNRCVKKCKENQKRILKDNQFKCVSKKD
jgi:serine/threonine protein kinase